jgi:hypothetical protein
MSGDFQKSDISPSELTFETQSEQPSNPITKKINVEGRSRRQAHLSHVSRRVPLIGNRSCVFTILISLSRTQPKSSVPRVTTQYL